MKRENVDKVIEWFKEEVKGRPIEGQWVKRSKMIEVCKQFDVPLSYLKSHGIFSECKEAWSLIKS